MLPRTANTEQKWIMQKYYKVWTLYFCCWSGIRWCQRLPPGGLQQINSYHPAKNIVHAPLTKNNYYFFYYGKTPGDQELTEVQTAYKCTLLWPVIINKTIVQQNRIKSLHHSRNPWYKNKDARTSPAILVLLKLLLLLLLYYDTTESK